MWSDKDNSDKEEQAGNIGCGAIVLIIIFGLGIYYNSLVAQILGVLLLCALILAFIANKTNSDIFENIAMVPGILAVLTFIYIAIFASPVKVTDDGDKYHYYKNCPAIAGKEYHKVMKADAYLMGIFSECKHCKKRKAEKERQEREQYEEDGTDYIPGVPSRYQ